MQTAAPAVAPPRPARWNQIATVVLALAVVVMAVIVVGILKGVVPLAGNADPKPSGSPSPSPSASLPAVAVAAPVRPAGATVVVSDPLTTSGNWRVRDDQAVHQTTCTFAGALVVTKQSAGSYRCPGPQQQVSDFTAFVDVKLLKPGSCAGVWFRFDEGGYAVRICTSGYVLVSHGAGDASVITALHSFPVDRPLPLGTVTRVGISASGNDLTFYRDGWQVGHWRDATFQRGRVVLGVFQAETSVPPPFSVSFAKVEIWEQ